MVILLMYHPCSHITVLVNCAYRSENEEMWISNVVCVIQCVIQKLSSRRESSRHQGYAFETESQSTQYCKLKPWHQVYLQTDDWTVNRTPFKSIPSEHAIDWFLLCLIYHFTLQIKALCLYTFHPVLSTTAGLSWSSGQLITAAIHWGNQSVNHCENQSAWGILKSSRY